MANSFSLLASLFIILLLVSTSVSAITKTTSIVGKDQVPCQMMCTECENPCQPMPLPPPPPQPVIECPPPPPPPVPSPPPPPPPRVAATECPPPPKTIICPGNCEMPPRPPYPPTAYYPPGTPYPYYVPYNNNNGRNSGAMVLPFPSMQIVYPGYFFITMRLLITVAFLCLPYYLFV